MVYKKSDFNGVFLWYILTNFALGLFLHGFFPIKQKFVNSVIDPPTSLNDIRLNPIDLYHSKINRVIFIVIDALRKDFVDSQFMPYLTKHVYSANGCFLKVKAESPTVTMPRIKAMTTGSIPQFIDIILNFASSEIKEDSFLYRAKDLRKKMIFYGDETWLKLYPNLFLRSEGTSSFYVTDYTEVDYNVTRHIVNELKNEDWTIMFLHYLGLDHIGHVYGPQSQLISFKLLEMDQIIQNIHIATTNTTKDTLVLICGDHGMRDTGGHGGASLHETIVPLAILGLNCENNRDMIMQTDIAPTVSALLALPLPSDSVGKVIPNVLESFNLESKLYILHYNMLNLIQKSPRIFKNDIDECFEIYEKYLYSNDTNLGNLALKLYNQNIQKISENLVKTASSQNLFLLYISCSFLCITFLAILTPSSTKIYYTFAIIIICSITLDFFVLNETSLTLFMCFLIPVLNITWLYSKIVNYFYSRILSMPLIYKFLLGGTVTKILCLAGTSFIEEEHQIWYFFWVSFVILGACNELNSVIKLKHFFNVISWISMAVGFRILRNMNRVGDKWSALPDISDWLQKPENKCWLQIVFILGLFGTWYFCHIHHKQYSVSVSCAVTFLCIFWYRSSLFYEKSKVHQVYIIWTSILISAFISYKNRHTCYKMFTLIWTLWITLLLRPYNVILIPLCAYSSHVLRKLCTELETKVVAHIWLSTVFFYSQGNCNSLASIDISAGYVGLSDYYPFITIFQVIVHTYAFQVLSHILLFDSLKSDQDKEKLLKMLIVYRTANVTYFCLIILLQRNHLFIWTVFSPKLLIETCHTVVLFVGITFYKCVDYIN